MTMQRRSTSGRNIVPLRTALERFMDWPLNQFDGGLTELAPPIDVRETNDAYVVDIDLPGIDPQNVEVLVEGRTLSVRGRFDQDDEKREGGYLLKERRTGDFVRAIALPGMVDTDAAQSNFDNGLLVVTLPKAAQNRARKIEIQGGKSGMKRVGQGEGQAVKSDTGQSSQDAAGRTGEHSTS